MTLLVENGEGRVRFFKINRNIFLVNSSNRRATGCPQPTEPEHLATFRYLREPQSDARIRSDAVNGLTVEDDAPTTGRLNTGYGLQKGRLSGAVGTNERENSTFADAHADIMQDLDAAVLAADILDSRTGCLTDAVIFQIGPNDAFVALHLLRRTLADRSSPVQNVDLIGYSHDQFHVMFHQQHGYAGIGYPSYQRFDLRRFRRIATGGRLVEEGRICGSAASARAISSRFKAPYGIALAARPR